MPTPEQQEILDALATAAVDLQVLMPETADVVRVTVTPDGFGGQSATETVIASVPARRSALSGSELWKADKLAPDATYAVTVPPTTDVTEADAFIIDGQRFEVLFVPRNTFAAQLRCLCKVA